MDYLGGENICRFYMSDLGPGIRARNRVVVPLSPVEVSSRTVRATRESAGGKFEARRKYFETQMNEYSGDSLARLWNPLFVLNRIVIRKFRHREGGGAYRPKLDGAGEVRALQRLKI